MGSKKQTFLTGRLTLSSEGGDASMGSKKQTVMLSFDEKDSSKVDEKKEDPSKENTWW
jgi:hypothetical protein